MTKKRTDHTRRVPYPLQELDPKEVDKAYQEWLDEDDGTDDYPSLGEVLAAQFGRPKKPTSSKTANRVERLSKSLESCSRLVQDIQAELAKEK